jgi:hypothetical protein
MTGIPSTITATSCTGSSATQLIFTDQLSSATTVEVVVQFASTTPILPGATGTPLTATMTILVTESDGASEAFVTTPCTITLSENTSAPTADSSTRFLLAGIGTCSAMAFPLDSGAEAGAGLTIGQFTFNSFIP